MNSITFWNSEPIWYKVIFYGRICLNNVASFASYNKIVYVELIWNIRWALKELKNMTSVFKYNALLCWSKRNTISTKRIDPVIVSSDFLILSSYNITNPEYTSFIFFMIRQCPLELRSTSSSINISQIAVSSVWSFKTFGLDGECNTSLFS